ncbi:hypothetical protein [Streptomyces lushanensis]|uniref:hypothetical protein n=1 Tax=Streptomyces lushanensis TaxID=1434255 RepID=UPI00114D23DF|nr:hypothetical protein [Streptomyces lushanensis]
MAVSVQAGPSQGEPRVRPDPAAVLSAVHGWLDTRPSPAPALPAVLDCVVGGRPVRALLTYATQADASAEL